MSRARIGTIAALVLAACVEAPSATGQDYGWGPLSSGMNDDVYALTVYDSELIAGGRFTTAGGVTCNHIAGWDGSAWQPLGSGMDDYVLALTVYNGELIAGGSFTTADGVTCNRIARWNGSVWQPLGPGISPTGSDMESVVEALTVYGGDLIAGGYFTAAGEVPCNSIARWDGNAWQPPGSGIGSDHTYPFVSGLSMYDGELIAGGNFETAGDEACISIARWNGSAWQPLGLGVAGQESYSGVYALSVYNGELIVGGLYLYGGCYPCNNIASWNGSAWRTLGSGLNGAVSSLAVYSADLIAAGYFAMAGDLPCNNIADWNGGAWQPLGSGLNGFVAALTVYNDELIAAGDFTTAGSVTCEHIARWKRPGILLGDLDCDGTVGFADINPFVQYLSNFSAWQATYPECPPLNGDINSDGTYGYLSFGDINPFVTLLTGGE